MIARMRARYLAAMGLAAACAKQPAPETSDASTTTVTATATVSALPPHWRLPSCPHGDFCVPAPQNGVCAATVPMPNDGGIFGPPHVTFDDAGTANARAKDPKTCCYTWVIPCPGGRALRDQSGASVVARATARTDWIDEAARAAAEVTHDRDAMAERWAREAAFEHASIASFARVTLDLLALGAPADLVAEAQRAALDEVEHARIAYALASAFGGELVGPGPLPDAPRPRATLESLVREAVVEGCIGEARAALALHEESRAAYGAYAALLARMAEDEERHAALAFATVAWAMTVDPVATARVVDEALAGESGFVTRAIAAPCLAALKASASARADLRS